MNTDRIIRLAIITAVYNRSWSNDTHFYEMYPDFDDIAREAYYTLADVGIDHEVSHQDIADTLWGESVEDLLAELEAAP